MNSEKVGPHYGSLLRRMYTGEAPLEKDIGTD